MQTLERYRCTVDGCAEARVGRKWCGRHYSRWRKYGDPLASAQRNRPTANEPNGWPRHAYERYGLTAETFGALWERQSGECAICGRALEMSGMRSCNVDHDHATGVVRGLLCRACNRGIGLLGDDADRLGAAARYLRRLPAGDQTID